MDEREIYEWVVALTIALAETGDNGLFRWAVAVADYLPEDR